MSIVLSCRCGYVAEGTSPALAVRALNAHIAHSSLSVCHQSSTLPLAATHVLVELNWTEYGN